MAAALALAVIAGCAGPPPVEVDGNRIRETLARVALGDAEAERSLVDLAGRSGDARALILREAGRLQQAAARRAEEARQEEAEISVVGRGLTQEEQKRLTEVVGIRVESERAAAALAELLAKLR